MSVHYPRGDVLSIGPTPDLYEVQWHKHRILYFAPFRLLE